MRFIYIIILFLIAPDYSFGETPSYKTKKLFFITPLNGEQVISPVTIKFGITGMNILPAGVNKPMSGHHHLLINVKKLPNMNSPIPADNNHLHFGKGQTEVQLNLPSGRHTLQLLFGDYMHIPHEKPLISDKIEIIVK